MRKACFIILVIAAASLAIPQVTLGQPEGVGPSADALEALEMIKDKDSYQRKVGFFKLEALREAETADTIRAYVDSKDSEMRGDSLRALAAIEGAQAIPLLLEKLETDRHPRVRRAVLLSLEILRESDPERIIYALIGALSDRNTEVRMTAADVVSRIDDPRARDAILERYDKERRKDVRKVLDMAMRRLER